MDPLLYGLLITLAVINIGAASTTTLQKAADVKAEMVQLYSSASVSMPNQQFVISFSTAFGSVPTFVYGINQYKLGDQFLYQNFQSVQSGLSGTQANVSVTSTGSTNIRLFSISYMASTNGNIGSAYHSYTSSTNISTGSGDRYLLVYYNKAFPSINSLALPLLTGYYIVGGTYFLIAATAAVLSTVNYQVRIATTWNCKLFTINLYVLFVQTDQLSASNYYYKGGMSTIVSQDVNLDSFTATVDNYTKTQFMLAIRGFGGFTALSGCQWGWTVTNVSGDVATLTLGKKQLQQIYFSYLQIGQEVSDTSSGGEGGSAEEGGGSFIGIIAGLVAGIAVVAVVIVLALKFYWSRQVFNIPSHNDFKEMPSLTF